MRTIFALGALVAVLAFAGCGGSAEAAGPQDTIQAWTNAIAAHDWAAACALEEEAYRGEACEATYAMNVDGLSAAAGVDVAADFALDPATCKADGEAYSCVVSSTYTGPIAVVAEQIEGEWRIVRAG